jgi:hypothetical protein
VIRLVLDTSAVAAFGTGLDVGEVVSEIADEGHRVGVPVVCLLEARSDHWELLAGHPAIEVLPVKADRLAGLVAARKVLGRLDMACALDAAREHQAWILTGETAAYGTAGKDIVIGL